jgi:hypothetical protein
MTAALWRLWWLWRRFDIALRRCVRVHCRASIAFGISSMRARVTRISSLRHLLLQYGEFLFPSLTFGVWRVVVGHALMQEIREKM